MQFSIRCGQIAFRLAELTSEIRSTKNDIGASKQELHDLLLLSERSAEAHGEVAASLLDQFAVVAQRVFSASVSSAELGCHR